MFSLRRPSSRNSYNSSDYRNNRIVLNSAKSINVEIEYGQDRQDHELWRIINISACVNQDWTQVVYTNVFIKTLMFVFIAVE